MTYNQVLCANNTLLINNSYQIECFSIDSKLNTAFSNRKDSLLSMLDVQGDLALWYTGEEIVVFDFQEQKTIWAKKILCQKCDEYFTHYYCEGLLSPKQSKVAYRTEKRGYVIVDLKTTEEILIENSDWHPFFSPDDKYFSVGGKVYLCETGMEIENPFPFEIQAGLTYFDTFSVKTNGRLMALRQGHGGNPLIEIWDYEKRELLTKIKDIFTIKQCVFDFTESSLVVHNDSGVVSVYNMTK